MAENKIELFELEGSRNSVFKLRNEAVADKMGDLTNEQILVLQVIERSERNGVWLRDIKVGPRRRI